MNNLNKMTLQLRAGKNLDLQQSGEALKTILSGNPGHESIASFLKALSDKGETVDEIVGFAQVLMQHGRGLVLEGDPIDLCGTGGSGLTRFNVSTAVAFVLAAQGVKVAKHGNKGSKRPNGSFDLLEKLGVRLDATPEQQLRLYSDFGLCFLFARAHHPAVKAAGPARASLGTRTIFNLIGPLCNPAGVTRQIVGVSDSTIGPIMIEALRRLGRTKAFVPFGHPGLDEFSVCGSTRVWSLENGNIGEHLYRPEDFGLRQRSPQDLPGGDVENNEKIFRRLLDGEELNGLQDMVCLNAAAGLQVCGLCTELREGIQTVRDTLKLGTARKFFDDYLAACAAL